MSDGEFKRVDPDRARQFEDLAVAVELLADLRPDHRFASDWILTDYDYAAEARAFGEFWWLNLTTGRSYVANRTAALLMAPCLHPALAFDECISGMQQALGHVISLAGQARQDARDGMALARARPRRHQVAAVSCIPGTVRAPKHG
jgi:hypothetical protein